MQTGPFSHLPRCFTVIDPRWQFRVCAGFKKQLNRQLIPSSDRDVQRSAVVNAALIPVCAEGKQQTENFVDVSPRRCALQILRTAKRGDEWRKSVVYRQIRISTDFEKLADECQWAVVDRVDETVPDRGWHLAIGHQIRIVDGSAQRVQITLTKRCVDALKLFCLRAALAPLT